MYIKTSKVIFVMVIQFLNGTVNVLGDFGVKTLLSTALNETGLLRSLEKLKDYKIIIPEECKTKKFCENIPNYPEEIMTEIIERLAAYVVVNKHSAPLAVHGNSTGLSLCNSQKWNHVPLAVEDEAGKWVLVVNSKVNPVQTYEGESCRSETKYSDHLHDGSETAKPYIFTYIISWNLFKLGSAELGRVDSEAWLYMRSDIFFTGDDQKSLCKSLTFQHQHHGECTDMYVKKKVLVINEEMNLLVETPQNLPCCCMCGTVRKHLKVP